MMLQFGSQIRFLPKDAYARQDFGKQQHVQEFDNNNIRLAKKAYTVNVVMCNAGGITNGRRTLMFHLQPWGDTKKNLRKLAKDIKTLRHESPDLRALVLGGHSSDPRSIQVNQGLCRLLEKEKIPYSLFWGHKHYPYKPPIEGTSLFPPTWRSELSYRPDDDTWRVYTHWYDGQDLNDKLAVRTPKDLAMAFEYIYVDPGDKVILGTSGKALPAAKAPLWRRILGLPAKKPAVG